MQIQIHERLIHQGYFSGDEAYRALYWASRIATNLEKAARYDSIRRPLQEIIFDGFRILNALDPGQPGKQSHAVSRKGVIALNEWAQENIHKFTEKQMVDGRQFLKAVEELKQAAFAAS